jgi:hypothetical protein
MKKRPKGKPKAAERDLTTQSPVRMTPALKERVREYQQRVKKEQGCRISLSEAIRALIEKGLEATS